eukprot:175775_1
MAKDAPQPDRKASISISSQIGRLGTMKKIKAKIDAAQPEEKKEEMEGPNCPAKHGLNEKWGEESISISSQIVRLDSRTMKKIEAKIDAAQPEEKKEEME